jgi:hypothetical protein
VSVPKSSCQIAYKGNILAGTVNSKWRMLLRRIEPHYSSVSSVSSDCCVLVSVAVLKGVRNGSAAGMPFLQHGHMGGKHLTISPRDMNHEGKLHELTFPK